MSADRMREAADRLTAYETHGHASTIVIPVSIDPWLLTSVPASALAELLRAHADFHGQRCVCWFGRSYPSTDPMCEAAFALADAVLGADSDDDEVCHGCEHARGSHAADDVTQFGDATPLLRHYGPCNYVECHCPEYVP